MARYVVLSIWMHIVMLIWTLGNAELTFLDLGTTSRVSTRSLINSVNFVTNAIQTAQFPIDNVTVTEAYVSENGLISFGRGVSQPPQTSGTGFSPDIMTDSDYIVAPFWSDNDIRGPERNVMYEVHTTSVNSQRLVEVSQFIGNETGTPFTGEWMLFVEWRECHPFPYDGNVMTTDTYLQQTNTYQAVVVTDGSTRSYAVFIYNCNSTEWGGRNSIFARVGIRIGSREVLHPLSGSASVSDIDCGNESTSPWVNLLYDLVDFESSPSPNATSILLLSEQPSSTLLEQASLTSLEQASLTSLLTLTPSAVATVALEEHSRSQSIIVISSDTTVTFTSLHNQDTSSGFETVITSENRFQTQSDAHTPLSHTLSIIMSSMPPTEGEQQSGVALTVGLLTAAAAAIILLALVLLTTVLFIMYGKHHNKVQSATLKTGAQTPVNSNGLKSSLFVTPQPENEVLLLEDSYQF